MNFLSQSENEDIDPSRTAILTRNNHTISKLRPGITTELSEIEVALLPAVAIQIWKIPLLSKEQIEEALTCMGKFVASKYYSAHLNNRQNHYCPHKIKSRIEWRLFLAEILDQCKSNNELSDLEKLWKDWAASFRKNFEDIVSRAAKQRDSSEFTPNPVPTAYAALRGESLKSVVSTLKIIPINPPNIRIANFHQVKGETMDAVMVVSSPTNQGGGQGYWKNWLIDPKSEVTRFAYVASTRPRNLLVWAIPAPLDNKDKSALMELGFEGIDSF